MAEQSGFSRALEDNAEYKKLSDKLKVWKDKAPTEEISTSINDYERTSYTINSFIPLEKNPLVLENLPLKHRLQSIVTSKKSDDAMRQLLAKVRESITNYYQR